MTPHANLHIVRCASHHPDFLRMVRLLDAELLVRYGAQQAFYAPMNNVEGLATAVVVYIANEPAGCGCFRPMNAQTAELKRMFVQPHARGSLAATRVLTELERWATELGFREMLLETGNRQPEAIRFYQRMGYEQIPNFGKYADDPNSVCMRKIL